MTRTAEKPPIPSLEVRLFGGFEARVDDRPLPRLRSRRERWLLALLVLRQDRDTARDWLATTLWPDIEESQALFYLRKSLSNLRKALGGQAVRLLTPGPGTVRLDLTGAFVDIAAFDTAIAAGTVEDLERAVALYRGPLLEGCLEEWALPERAAREEAFYGALERLASDALAHGQPATAAGALRRLIASSPLRESAYVALMEALAASGDAAGVREAYQDLRLLLHREMNAEPAAQTRALYERLQQASRQPALSQAQEPAPASLRSSPSRRLPVPLTRLIGRESDITEVVDRFTQGRLVTLTGSGGVGKTRLSIAVAEAVAAEFADGVWLVELASLADPDLAVGTVAKAFQVKERPGQTIMETLTSALSSRSLLLVLDNCEHLLDGCAVLVEELLRQCAGLRVLATSREALGLFGEWVYRVPSLEVPPLPQEGTVPDADKNAVSHLLEYDAVRLFLERAAAQGTALRLAVPQTLAIAEICRQLDGIPLAIEMAAACVRTMTVEEICSRLSNRFHLLRWGNRTSLPRHKTLQALIDWSYDLLSNTEKVLLHRLSVFAGGWTHEAADYVCAEEGREISPLSVLSLLTSLVDKSLAVYEEWEGQARYRLLETVREYAGEKLAESGESEAVRERHRNYFLMLAEEVRPKLKGPEQSYWLAVLEEEHDNLRQALTFCLEQPDAGEAGLQLGAALQEFWWTRGYLSEGRERLTAVLSHSLAQEHTIARAEALNGAGELAFEQGDYAAARSLIEESLTMARELRDKQGIADALNNLGLVAYEEGDYAAAHKLQQESLALKTELGDRWGMANSLLNLGNVAYGQSQYASARTQYEESLTKKRELNDKRGVAQSLGNLGSVACEQGDYTAAHAFQTESLALQTELGDRWGIANTLFNLGNVAFRQGDYALARTKYEQSLTKKRELNDKRGVAHSLGNLGSVAYEEGDYTAAHAFQKESLALRRELGDQRGIAITLLNLGYVAYKRGDYASARTQYEQSLTIFQDIGHKGGVAECLEAFASLAIKEGREECSAQMWGAAEALREEIDSPLPPNEQEGYDSDVAKLRETLGEAAFLTAWEEGLAMTQEQASKYALQAPG